METHYDILGISKDASRAEIRMAANRLAHRYHSDTSTDGTTDSRYQKVIEAKAVLTNQKKREAYDRSVFGKEYDDTPEAPTFSFAGLARSDFLRKARGNIKAGTRKETFIGSRRSRRLMFQITLALSLGTFGASLLSWISAVFFKLSLVAEPVSAVIENTAGIILLVAVSAFRAYCLGRLRTATSFVFALLMFFVFASTASNGVFALLYLLLSASSFLLMLSRSRPSTVPEARKDNRVPASEAFVNSRKVFGDDEFKNTDDPISEPLRRETAKALGSLIGSSNIDNAKVFHRVERGSDVVADHVIVSGDDIILVGSASVDPGKADPQKVLEGQCRVYTPGLIYMRNSIRNLRAEFPRSRVRGIVLVVSQNGTVLLDQTDSGEVSVVTPPHLAYALGVSIARNQTPVNLDISGYMFRNCISRRPTEV